MHNCKEAKEQLTELLLDGDSRAEEVLDHCTECRVEFEALAATLRMTMRLRETVAPSESYWTNYHAELRGKLGQFHAKAQRLRHAKAPRKELKPGLGFVFASLRKPLRLCVKAFSVPVPLGVALLAFGLFVFAILFTRQPFIPAPLVVRVPIEVPVVQEKTITQVVYRDRQKPSKSTKRSAVRPVVENTFAQFKPTDDVKLTVIKGGSPNEK